jgi:hypothetical protein
VSTPAVGQVIDEGNVDAFLLPVGAVVIDRDGDAWQRRYELWWYCVDGNEAPEGLVHIVEAFGPVEVAWLPPDEPVDFLQEALNRRAA